jgi:hypothetical protein
MMVSPTKLLTDSSVLTQFNVDEDFLTATNIVICYDTLEGNQPNTYKNTVHLWQANDWEIPPSSPNLIKDPLIKKNNSSDRQNFIVNLTFASYLIAYAVGEGKAAVVTTQCLEPLGGGKYKVITPPKEEAISFEKTDINPTTVSYRFRMPRGTNAKDDGDWIGVWKNPKKVSDLYDNMQEPICFLPVEVDDSNGKGSLTLPDARQFEIDVNYMLGYFKSGFNSDNPKESLRTTLAAVISFKGPPAPSLTQFSVNCINTDATKINFRYKTLNGNKPNTYQNTVYLWQTEGWTVPSTTDKKHLITFDSAQEESQDFSVDLDQASYLIAYAVGPTVNAVVTTQRLEYREDSNSYEIISAPSDEALSLKVTHVDPTAVSYSFRTPAGTSAKANGDWVGVWQGASKANLYNKDKKPMRIKQVAHDDRKGDDVFDLTDGQQFVSGSAYLLGYFKSGFNSDNPEESLRTTLAATVEFKGP